MINIFNAYSGKIHEIPEEELVTILEGDIPLVRFPKTSCKKCYGRGYTGFDKVRSVYQLCVNCIEKNVTPGYDKQLLFNCIIFNRVNKYK